jgi:hypothetical protein
MPDKRLIRALFHLFSWMLNGLGAVFLIFMVVLPLALTWQTYNPRPATFGPESGRIRYDTALRADEITMSFNPAVTDGYGQQISRITGEDGILRYYSEDNHLFGQYSIDSLRRVVQSPPNQLPVALRSRILADRNRQTRQIDSVLRADPNAHITRLPDRWITHSVQSGFAWTIQVPVFSGSVFRYRSPGPWISPHNWSRQVSHPLDARLELRVSREVPYQLTIGIHRWPDLIRPFWPLAGLSLLSSLLWFLLPGAVLQWLREILSELLDDTYFASAITSRFRRIGGAFIAMFFARNLLDILKPFAANEYLQTQGFMAETWVYAGPDHWLWLFIGLVTLVLAQIFHYGSLLQREQDLTI